MKNERDSVRSLKNKIFAILESSLDYHDVPELSGYSLLKIINSLFSFLYHKNPVIKWNAVTLMGATVSGLAGSDMESARNIIRRLMWNLNDESGGIGWGSAEAMGEILATNHALAEEYASVLLSYARKDGNYQENELMQRGVLWGIGRFCQSWQRLPEENAGCYIIPFLDSKDAGVRALAAWVLGMLKLRDASRKIEDLTEDKTEIKLFIDNNHIVCKVKDVAERALERITREPVSSLNGRS